MSMVAEFDEELKSAVSDMDFGVVKTGKPGFSKIITMGNVIDQERFEEMMSSPRWSSGINRIIIPT